MGAAAFTIDKASPKFPAGTTVGAYDALRVPGQNPVYALTQTPAASAQVAADGSLVYAGLEFARRYMAVALVGSEVRSTSFTTVDDPFASAGAAGAVGSVAVSTANAYADAKDAATLTAANAHTDQVVAPLLPPVGVVRHQGDNAGNITAQAHSHYVEPGVTVDEVRPTRFYVRFTLIGSDAAAQLCLIQFVVNGQFVDSDRVTIPAGVAVPLTYEWVMFPGEIPAGAASFGFIASTVDNTKQVTLLNSGGFVYTAISHQM